eukprot:m.34321 g.34321  ORF g.34321 m.34321 type:complete len:308 (-) comp13041_c0_seq2:51-974(-)
MTDVSRDLTYLVCGGISGCVSRTLVSPLERLKILAQVQYVALKVDHGAVRPAKKYNGIFPALRLIYKEEGWLGFYKGNAANCIRVFPYVGIQFVMFEKLKGWLKLYRNDPHHKPTGVERLFVGGLSGVVSVTFTYPLDTIRGRLTAQGGLTKTAYRGIVHAGIEMTKTEGWRSLYRGFAPAAIGIAPYVGVNYLTFESLKDLVPHEPDTNAPNAVWTAVCGGVAGTSGQTVAFPFDVLRRRFQLKTPDGKRLYSGVWNAVSTIVREEGLRGLYAGYWVNFVKVVPTIMTMFWVNDMLKRELKRRQLL